MIQMMYVTYGASSSFVFISLFSWKKKMKTCPDFRRNPRARQISRIFWRWPADSVLWARWGFRRPRWSLCQLWPRDYRGCLWSRLTHTVYRALPLLFSSVLGCSFIPSHPSCRFPMIIHTKRITKEHFSMVREKQFPFFLISHHGGYHVNTDTTSSVYPPSLDVPTVKSAGLVSGKGWREMA